nr:MAG TPA: hypothetical protein [Caudoviricetes sp.]DAM20055.1 MAG TPA: hypothetical protein [Caudoviricetes sp.]DAN82347.1 MAG TPA: hypothetical protein [Caudoviricetes sp.]DAO58989.1 MAG TPA: hypothetical protein [Bacteriophage sp.]DAT63504.1 MAG TPA: hypothetical protein [Caudoviricetes sp.]
MVFAPNSGQAQKNMCQNEGAGLYPYPHSFHPSFLSS